MAWSRIWRGGEVTGEIVFNTSLSGYQEILSDPSYHNQIITFTMPHIGNVGVNSQDKESVRAWAAAQVVRSLSPEMRSTGEVMGHADRFGHAFVKAQMAAGTPLPQTGAVLISVNDFDKSAAMKVGRDLHRLGFALLATEGTAAALRRVGLPVTTVSKAFQPGVTTVDLIVDGMVDLSINTPLARQAHHDQAAMHAAAIEHRVPLITTLSAAQAVVNGIRALSNEEIYVYSL